MRARIGLVLGGGAIALVAFLLMGAFGAQRPVPSTPPAPPTTAVVSNELTPAISLEPDAGIRGAPMTIAGTGWQPNMSVTIAFRPGSVVIALPIDLGVVVADGQGRFELQQAVPESAVPGPWRVTATAGGRTVQIATVPFSVLSQNADAVAAASTATAATAAFGLSPEAALPPGEVATTQAASPSASTGAPVWLIEYYNNPDLVGAPAITRTGSVISYTWGLDVPDPSITPDNFSARWSTVVWLPAGKYRASAQCDDGLRAFVDGVLVIDTWLRGCGQGVGTLIDLSAGDHDLQVHYHDRADVAFVRFDILPASDQATVAPRMTATPEPSPTATTATEMTATEMTATPNSNVANPVPPPAPTAEPPTNMPVPPTAVPPTNTPVPPTSVPPSRTPVPPTPIPLPPTPTAVPPTPVPPTPVPPTPVPPTPVPPTPVPPTPPPLPTLPPPTLPLPTIAPPATDAPQPPPTEAPEPTPEPTHESEPTPEPTHESKPTHEPKPTKKPKG